jgi:hypothetical protein
MKWAGGQAQSQSIGSYGEPQVVYRAMLAAAPSSDKQSVLLANLRDFIGTDGIVREEYSGKAGELCAQINAMLGGKEGT